MYKERDFEELWSKYEGLLSRLENEEINKLIDKLGQRIIMTSYSQKESEPFCGIGGIVEYALELAKTASLLSSTLNYNVSKGSIVKSSLLSIIGRIGNDKYDRFVEQDSDWHKEKLGQYFKWNEDCEKYKIQDMALYYIQRFNIFLSWDEWQAIALIGEENDERAAFYSESKSKLAQLLDMSHRIVISTEKDKISGDHVIPF